MRFVSFFKMARRVCSIARRAEPPASKTLRLLNSIRQEKGGRGIISILEFMINAC
jgi:hypothetical protein